MYTAEYHRRQHGSLFRAHQPSRVLVKSCVPIHRGSAVWNDNLVTFFVVSLYVYHFAFCAILHMVLCLSHISNTDFT